MATALMVDEGKDMKTFNISANVIRDSSITIRTSRRSYLPAIELGTATKLQKKNMNSPDETPSFDKGKVGLTTLSKTKSTIIIYHNRYIVGLNSNC
jgi:hypothetical protein